MTHDRTATTASVASDDTQGAARLSPGERSWAGVALMACGPLSNQLGASIATLAFPVFGPTGVVAIRQWVAAIVLGVLARPRFWKFTAAQWRVVLGLAAVFALMNLTLYGAIDRIGLGLAVTLEFVGPLAVALSGSRRVTSVVCAIAAAGAVAVLMRPTPTTDYLGIGLALIAAAGWAGYILLNREVGARIPGIEGSAAAAMISGILYIPVGVWILVHHSSTLTALTYAIIAGVLSSAIPFLTDMLALRRIAAPVFGMFSSVNPVIAVLVGFLVLGQTVDLIAWGAILVIVIANITVLASADRAARSVGKAGTH